MLNVQRSCLAQFLVLPAVLLALTVAGLAQTQGPEPRGSARFQEWLTEEVSHRLVMLPWYSVFDNLQYKVNGSEVTLLGQVLEDRTKKDAESRVKGIEGVTKVINNIEILPASPNDDRIRNATYRAIFRDSLGKYSMGTVQPVHIVVKNGHVTLVGSVLNAADRQLMEIRAKGVSGVFSVTNSLRIENSQTDAEKSKS
jgi:hyperosmotically inducible protein